jgi:hypothetical protein
MTSGDPEQRLRDALKVIDFELVRTFNPPRPLLVRTFNPPRPLYLLRHISGVFAGAEPLSLEEVRDWIRSNAPTLLNDS